MKTSLKLFFVRASRFILVSSFQSVVMCAILPFIIYPPLRCSRCCGVLSALHPLVSVSLCEENYSFSFLRGAGELFCSTNVCTTLGKSTEE